MRIDAEELMENRKVGVNKPKEPSNDNKGIIAIVIAIIIIIILMGMLLVVL